MTYHIPTEFVVFVDWTASGAYLNQAGTGSREHEARDGRGGANCRAAPRHERGRRRRARREPPCGGDGAAGTGEAGGGARDAGGEGGSRGAHLTARSDHHLDNVEIMAACASKKEKVSTVTCSTHIRRRLAAAGADALDGLHNGVAVNHLPKHGVLPIQKRGGACAQEELGAVGVWASVGH